MGISHTLLKCAYISKKDSAFSMYYPYPAIFQAVFHNGKSTFYQLQKDEVSIVNLPRMIKIWIETRISMLPFIEE